MVERLRDAAADNPIDPSGIADSVEPIEYRFPIRDPKDRPFLALVATPPEPDLPVTGDKDYTAGQYGKVPVVKAADLARTLERG